MFVKACMYEEKKNLGCQMPRARFSYLQQQIEGNPEQNNVGLACSAERFRSRVSNARGQGTRADVQAEEPD